MSSWDLLAEPRRTPMQVLCPSCETEYEIPELQRPRKLRCARCASEWRVAPESETEAAPALADIEAEFPPEPEPEPEMPASPEIAAALDPPLPEQRLGSAAAGHARARFSTRRGDLLIGLLWLASLLLIAAGLWALWHWRGPVAHRWPPSLRLYRLLPGGVPSGGPSTGLGRRAA